MYCIWPIICRGSPHFNQTLKPLDSRSSVEWERCTNVLFLNEGKDSTRNPLASSDVGSSPTPQRMVLRCGSSPLAENTVGSSSCRHKPLRWESVHLSWRGGQEHWHTPKRRTHARTHTHAHKHTHTDREGEANMAKLLQEIVSVPV